MTPACLTHALLLAVMMPSPPVPAPRIDTVEVAILGSLHLRQRAADAVPVAIGPIRQRLEAYHPDQVVIEWLHPSIPAESTFNYAPLGDRRTLAQLWGLPAQPSAAMLDSLRAVQRSTPISARLLRAAQRLQVGQVLYLRGDPANAAYQWYLARRGGGDISGVGPLVEHLLGGHEAVEFGFAAAAAAGLEEVTPFDYQGPEAGSEVWGEMLEAMADTGVARVDGLGPASPGWTAARARFDSLRGRWEANRDSSWVRRYGALPFVAQYTAALGGFAWYTARLPADTDGLTTMRWLQAPDGIAAERHVQADLIGGIRFGGWGPRRLAGIMRRNERMADFLEADARRIRPARILVVVGSGHKWALEEILARRGYRIRPTTEFVP